MLNFCLCRGGYNPCFTNRYTTGYLQRLSKDFVGTPTYHSSSSLLSFLCPYTHISLHSSLLSFLCLPQTENGPRQAERHEGSHGQQLGQLANGRAGDNRRPVYKEAYQPTRVQFSSSESRHSKEVNGQQHNKKELLQGSHETAHNARLPGHAASWTRPSSATASSRWPATVPTALPRPTVGLHSGPAAYRRTATSYAPPYCRGDICRADQSSIGRALSPHALLQACAIVRLLGLRPTVQPTIVVNKYCCIYVILRLC